MELDRRTRRDADLRVIDVDAYFGGEFADVPQARKVLAARGIRHLDAASLGFRVGDSAWTISAGDILVATKGTSSDAVTVELDAAQFSNWVQQQVTFNALLTGRSVRLVRGSPKDLAAWDAAWLALLEGWPVFEEGVRFIGRDGNCLDLQQAFTPDDPGEDIAHFFREAGFLHLRGWLEAGDMARIGQEIDSALPCYEEGDGKSWWATVDGGVRACVRLQHFVEHSPTTAGVLASDAWAAVRQAVSGTDELTQPPIEGNCIEALVKPLGVVEGVSDVPWHRDCNFGRHAYQCAGAVVGISVDPGNEESGLLRVVAGSHRVSMPPYRANQDPYLPVVPVVTEQGDITVHQSCTLHEATPPLVRPRRVMYTGFGLPPTADTSQGHSQKRDLEDLRERAHKLQSQPRSPVARAR